MIARFGLIWTPNFWHNLRNDKKWFWSYLGLFLTIPLRRWHQFCVIFALPYDSPTLLKPSKAISLEFVTESDFGVVFFLWKVVTHEKRNKTEREKNVSKSNSWSFLTRRWTLITDQLSNKFGYCNEPTWAFFSFH